MNVTLKLKCELPHEIIDTWQTTFDNILDSCQEDTLRGILRILGASTDIECLDLVADGYNPIIS